MAVVSVQRRNEGEQASLSGAGWQYTLQWLVILNDPTDGARTAALASADGVSIPSIGDAHPADGNAFARRVNPHYYGDRLHYLVDVDYETRNVHGFMGGHRGDQEEDPLNDPVEVSWDTEFMTVPIEQALNAAGDTKVAVLNSALYPFDPPLEQEEASPAVTIVRNESSIPLYGADYVHTINSVATTVAGLPVKKWQARIVQLTPQRAERNGIRYWQVTYRILFKLKDIQGNDDDWTRHVLDQGYIEWPDGIGEGKKRRRISVDGKECKEPQRLNGSGLHLDPKTPAAGSVWLSFITYRLRDFSPLNLDFNP